MASSLTTTLARGQLEQLHREQPGDAELVGDPQRQLLRGRGGLVRQSGRRGEHLDALAVGLHGLHDRPAAACPNGERATSAASSLRIDTRCSAISGMPAARSSSTSSGVGSSHTPRPS